MTQAYDIIPDIHADIDRLTQALSTLGFVQEGDIWANPEGVLRPSLAISLTWAMQTAPFSLSPAPSVTEGIPWQSWATMS